MTTFKKVINQINDITTKMVKDSFSIRENFASDSGNEINWSGYKNISFTLRDAPYEEIYKQCIQEQAYNFVLFDNALIQFMYRIKDDKIISHRLVYFPHPNFINYQDSPDNFEFLSYGDEYFTEVIEKNIISVPIRFDYDYDVAKFRENSHSYSHLTIGNYKDCRIPVSKPISPNKFILFILRSFYNKRFNEFFKLEDFNCDIEIDESITKNEKDFLFIDV